MQWSDAPVEMDGPMLLFQVDMTDGSKETHVGWCNESGDMVYANGDAIGWEHGSVSRWVLLNTVLASFIE